jgi:hypothetical protein
MVSVDGAFLFRQHASHFDNLPTHFDLFWSFQSISIILICFDPFWFWHRNCQNILIARRPFWSVSIPDRNCQNKASQASCMLSTWLHACQPFVITGPSGHGLQARPEGKCKLKGLWAQEKGNVYMYCFCNEIKFHNRYFRSHEASNTWILILWPLWLCLDAANP